MHSDNKICKRTASFMQSKPAFLKSVHEYAKCNKPQQETRVVVSYISAFELANRGACWEELRYPGSPARQLETSTSQWTLSGADQNPKQGNGGGIKRPDYLINACNN